MRGNFLLIISLLISALLMGCSANNQTELSPSNDKSYDSNGVVDEKMLIFRVSF